MIVIISEHLLECYIATGKKYAGNLQGMQNHKQLERNMCNTRSCTVRYVMYD